MTQAPIPASKRYATRTGACTVGTCECKEFAHQGLLDGFITCECAHTQVSHREATAGEGTIDS